MTAPFNVRPRIAVLLALAFSGIVAQGQATTSSNNDSVSVTLTMQADQIQIGCKPWAVVTVYNISGQPVFLSTFTYRVYVYGKDGEAPTMLAQRQFTGRLRPGDAPLNYTPNVEPSTLLIWPTGGPADSVDRKFDLTYLYDLSAPGKYTAYAEVMDPSSHRWLRTKTVTFEMTQ